MVKKKLTKEEVAIKYIWEQIERWLLFRYRITRKVIVLADYIQRDGLYSRVDYRGRDIYVTVDKGLLREGDKLEMLKVVGRSAVQIKFNIEGKDFNEEDEEVKEELTKYGLPVYGNIPQVGLKLRQYTCSKCDKIVRVSVRKVPKSEEFEYNPKKLTKCCHAVIKDDGWVHFTNQDAHRLLATVSMK